MDLNIKKIDAISAPFIGFVFFLTRPKLWAKPLFAVLFSLFVLLSLVIGIIWTYWPAHILLAVGLGAFTALLFWVFGFTFILNFAFQKVIREAFQECRLEIQEDSLLKDLHSGWVFFRKTLWWRCFWPIFSLITTIAIPPIGFLIMQIAIGHTVVMDAFDLALSLNGKTGEEKHVLFKNKSLQFLIAGIVAGVGSCFLLPTILLWVFWIPGVYLGAAFLSQRYI